MAKNIAVILAGGSGVRFNADRPKQFLKLAGKSILEHTLDVFQAHRLIDEIAIVCHGSYIGDVEDIVNKSRYDKVKKVLAGGETRYHSSLSAIRAYQLEHPDATTANLIFHDAVRPFIRATTIDHVVGALAHYRAVDVAIPASDTVIRVDGTTIDDIPDRSRLMMGQTPQAFRLDVIGRAYQLALSDPEFKATDDCGVVLRYLPEEPITVVRGASDNIKITYEVDLSLADKLIQIREQEISQHGDLSGLAGKVVVIFGGSYGIGKEIADLCRPHTPLVYSFSRSENGVDIKDTQAVRRSLAEVHARTGRIDCVINSAALLNKEPLANVSYETVEELMRVNYFGMVAVAKESFPYLQASKGGLLLFTSSSYSRGRASYSLYSSTKAAVVNFVQAVAAEWRPFDIRVNCINPERTLTPMRVRNFGIEPEDSLLSARKVAEVSLYTLLSSFTGQVIYVTR
jgi:ribitol-5-phosphate 2-dehydrogenase (NADP+) / D-ribitol-5-phosphate cytidylyltransferase